MSRNLWFSLMLAACEPPTDADTPADDTGVGVSDEEDANPTEDTCPLDADLPCEDDIFLALSLQTDGVAEGEVVSQAEGEGWLTDIDARAGGVQGAASSPWVYLRFTDEGAEKLPLTDVEALASGAWHLAAKRYQIRTNSADSGPSCVTAQALPSLAYEDVTGVEGEFEGEVDDFYTKSCTFVPDDSGLPDSPALALSDWWTYPGCVATTGIPFVLKLEDGRQVKLVVERYYAQGQETCNTEGTFGTGSAELQIRWAFLP